MHVPRPTPAACSPHPGSRMALPPDPPRCSRSAVLVSLALAAALTSGCNSGLIGSAAGGSSGSGNAPSSSSALLVLDAADSPARVRFLLLDAEEDLAEVQLSYSTSAQGLGPITQLTAPGSSQLLANPLELASAAGGLLHEFDWHYADEPGIGTDLALTDAVQVRVQVEGDLSVVPGANAATITLGNEPPSIVQIDAPLSEVDAVVPVPFTLSDSSADAVDVRVEYDVVDEVEDWQLARPAGLDSTPALAFQSLLSSTDGVDAVFFWETDVDLPQLEVEVRVRFTPIDALVEGTPSISAPFRIDNNAEPIGVIDEILWVENSDRRRGIRVPFTLFDAESDDLLVVPQWRSTSQEYPELPCAPCTREEIEALLADPAQRGALQLGGAYARLAGGSLRPVDANQVRLPELGTSASWAVDDLLGGELVVLREYAQPRATDWGAGALSAPIDVALLGGGERALVLEQVGAGWRVRELSLADGTELAVVASGSGAPTALALDPNKRFVFVASTSDVWRVERFDRAQTPALLAGELSGELSDASGVRGLHALGTSKALCTEGAALRALQFVGSGTGTALLTDGLATPWGVSVNPAQPDRVYVAETGADRIRQFDLGSNLLSELPTQLSAGQLPGFPSPRAIAVRARPDGTELLAVVDGPEGPALRSMTIGVSLDLDGDGALEPAQTNLEAERVDALGGLALGPEGLRVHAVPSANQLVLGGGIEQRRAITGVDLGRATVEVSPAFSPELRAGQAWRMDVTRGIFPSNSEGLSGSFLWDSNDARGVREIQLRLLAFDTEQGIGSGTSIPHELQSEYELIEAILVQEYGSVFSSVAMDRVTSGDLSGDGLIDLLGVDTFNGVVWLHRQVELGAYDEGQELGFGELADPLSVHLADIDSDGDLDVVVEETGDFLEGAPHRVSVYAQDAEGVFESSSSLQVELVEMEGELELAPGSMLVADLSSDGAPDLAAVTGRSEIVIAFQDGAGGFPAESTLFYAGNVSSIDSGDMDDDGDLDLISTQSFGFDMAPVVEVYAQVGNFQFPAVSYLPDIAPIGTGVIHSDIVASDLDDDGLTDIVLPTRTANTVEWIRRTPDGGYADPVSIPVSDLGLLPITSSVDVADLDGDGRKDLLVTHSLSEGAAVKAHFQLGQGQFDSNSVGVGPTLFNTSPGSSEFVDLNGDGLLDLVYLGEGDEDGAGEQGLWAFLLGRPEGYGDPVSVLSAEEGASPRQAVDLDGDGDLDFVALQSGISFTGLEIRAYEQVSPARFDPAYELLGLVGSQASVYVGDLDGNGAVDVVWLEDFLLPFPGADGLEVAFQDAPGTFAAAPVVYEANANLVAHGLHDFDGDQRLEVLARSNLGVWSFYAWDEERNLIQTPGPSGFGTSQSFSGAVAIGDLEGDGDLDLVAGGSDPANPTLADRIEIRRQLGGLVYEEESSELFGAGTVPNGLFLPELADLNQDGLLDIAVANGAEGAIYVYLQQDALGFDSNPMRLEAAGVSSSPAFHAVQVGDADADGDADLAAEFDFEVGLEVFYQLAPGVFDSTPRPPQYPDGFGTALVDDIDGDGDGDRLGADFQGEVQIRFGEH